MLLPLLRLNESCINPIFFFFCAEVKRLILRYLS
jgi:hypothetical protein